MHFRYDIELYLRIEHLIVKKLTEYPTEQEEVMMLQERVAEAQRFAKLVSSLHVQRWIVAAQFLRILRGQRPLYLAKCVGVFLVFGRL